jgi:hypothetical protein
MSVQTGTATDYSDLLNQLDEFLTSAGMALAPGFAGAGNGTIAAEGGSASVAEIITVTFTSATAFTVAGSVSGALGSGAVGTAFASTKANFTITAGSTAFSSGDVFTFSTAPAWTSLRRVAGSEMIWQAPGNGGEDAIVVGAKTFSSEATDFYDWRLGGFTAYDAGSAFEGQPGYVGGVGQTMSSPILTLWNSTIPYWFIANGRRVIIIAKISTVYVAAYLGFLNSYMSPGAFPYPLVVGGNLAFRGAEPALTSPDWRWSFEDIHMADFAIPTDGEMAADSDSSLQLRMPSGIYRGFCLDWSDAHGQVWPYAYVTTWDWRPNLDGSYSLLPIVLFDGTPNVYGELEGVFAVTGFSNAAENTITIGGIQYLVVQNVFRTDEADYFAVRLA